MLLVDRLAFMGGTSTAVLDTFYAFYTPGERPRRVVGGLGWEVAQRLTADGVAFERPNTYGAGTGVTYDAEALKVLWERLAEDAGVDLLLHTWVTGASVEDGRLTAVRLWNKGGERWVEASAFVDASGDADVCAMAGVPHDAPGDGQAVQSLSTLFKVANVDIAAASAVPKAELWRLMGEAAASGAYRLPRDRGLLAPDPVRRRGADPHDPDPQRGRHGPRAAHGRRGGGSPAGRGVPPVPARSRAGLRTIRDRGHEPGHRGAREPPGPRGLPPDPRGRPRRAPLRDEIALCGAPIEDHGAGGDTAWRHVGEGGGSTVYGIPYRTLLPLGIEGLLVAGRCFSATHDAHASARSMATCMAMGQAAGTAATLAVVADTVPRTVSGDTLREHLALDGALLEPVELTAGEEPTP